MENKELNKKMIQSVRNRIVISNLEEEESMKLNKRKQIVAVIAVTIVMVAGGFITMNAATNGEVVNQIKDKIKVVLQIDGKEEEVKGTTYQDSNHHTIERYEVEQNGTTHIVEIDKDMLEKEELEVNGTLKEKEINFVIENQK